MFFRVSFIIFCFINVLHSQKLNSDELDSLRIQQKYSLLLHKQVDLGIPTNLIIYNYYNSNLFSEIHMFNEKYDITYPINVFLMRNIANDINQSFFVFRKGENKYHLGVVSDILGYVGTAAVAGFAGYHLYKYRKKYGIK